MTYKENFFKTLASINLAPPDNFTKAKAKVTIICSCGHEATRTPVNILDSIKKFGILDCPSCCRVKSGIKRAEAYKKDFLSELDKRGIGHPLEYFDSNTKVAIVGECGHDIFRTPDKILRTIRETGAIECSSCTKKSSREEKRTGTKNEIIEELKTYGCELVSDYVVANDKIEIVGTCGHNIKRSIAGIRGTFDKLGKVPCRKCSYSKMGKIRRTSNQETKTYFKEAFGVDILEDKEFTEHSSVRIRHSCGHIQERKIYAVRSLGKELDGLMVCPTCSMGERSRMEEEISTFIKEQGINVIDNYRPGGTRRLEMDIYVPSKNIGIEYNGLHWHGERILSGKYDAPSNYHLDKTKFFKEEHGIDTIHIFESDWVNKKDIIKSIIASKLGVSKNRIYGRKCEAKIIDKNIANKFNRENHRQGSCGSMYNVGLYFNEKLVSVMTIGKSRFSKKYDTELLRFSSLLNTSVIGGFSKLLAFASKEFELGTMITYADIRYSNIDANATVYSKTGFVYSHQTKPNYFYFKRGKTVLYSRQKFQKHKLEGLLPNFNKELTEYQNMVGNNYDRVWDCGNHAFVKKFPPTK